MTIYDEGRMWRGFERLLWCLLVVAAWVLGWEFGRVWR